jgi:hypothetical protein
MRSGASERILSIFADVKSADAWFLAAGLWRPDEPEMRPCLPSKYSVSTVSSVRHTIRLGRNILFFRSRCVDVVDLATCGSMITAEQRGLGSV